MTRKQIVARAIFCVLLAFLVVPAIGLFVCFWHINPWLTIGVATFIGIFSLLPWASQNL